MPVFGPRGGSAHGGVGEKIRGEAIRKIFFRSGVLIPPLKAGEGEGEFTDRTPPLLTVVMASSDGVPIAGCHDIRLQRHPTLH